MYHSGIDSFTPDPGEWNECYCKLCNAKMEVRRNINGPTSSIQAMGNFTRWHDLFLCPNSKEPWHKKAIKIYLEKEKTESDRLKAILQADIDELVKSGVENE